MSLYAGQSPKQLYRSFFRYLRHLPDPHVWSVLQPRFRALLLRSCVDGSRDGNAPESSTRAILRVARARKNAEDELRRLQMAVSYYPHALRRLLDACYGRTGHVRWQLIRNVLATSDPPIVMQGRPALPPVLGPLAPPEPGIGTRPAPRARTTTPESAIRKKAEREWKRQWRGVQVPLVIAGTNTPQTGWEGRGVVESLRSLASLDPAPTAAPGHTTISLPTFDHLSPHLQRIFPRKLRPSPVAQYPSPPKRATKQNPATWSAPRRFTPRALRRTYARLWARLPWVTPLDPDLSAWTACSYEMSVNPTRPDPQPTKKRKGQAELVPARLWPVGHGDDKAWLSPKVDRGTST